MGRFCICINSIYPISLRCLRTCHQGMLISFISFTVYEKKCIGVSIHEIRSLAFT